MALTDNAFIGLPIETLQTLQAQCVRAIQDVLTVGKSESFPGHTFTLADLSEVQDVLSDVNQAIDVAAGFGRGRAFAQVVIDTQNQFDP